MSHVVLDGLPRTYPVQSARERRSVRKRDRHLRAQVDRFCYPPPPHRFGAFGRAVVVPPARVETPERVFLGDGVVVHELAWFSVVRHFPDIEPRLVIGEHTRVGRCCQFSVAGELTIGRGVIIGDFVQIGDTFHPYDAGDRFNSLVRPEPVRIGRGAILASHVVVLPGVTIGDGAYVEHHAVVTADVAPHEVVAGNPAKPRKADR